MTDLGTRTGPAPSGAGPVPRYPAIRDLAAIGDGRTVALISRDGTVCWLPFPSLDSPAVFSSLLDADRGGAFVLAPRDPYQVTRRYVADTNVLETTFTSVRGVARITDALTVPSGDALRPFRELVRRIDGVEGEVTFAWSVRPRFGFGLQRTTVTDRRGTFIASSGSDAMAVLAWDVGDTHATGDAIEGDLVTSVGSRSLLALSWAHQEPLVLPGRSDVERRLDATIDAWRHWTADRTIHGGPREAIVRSALTLKLLVHSPTGAVAAAPTTSLPEEIGGERNWDYRFSWLRDAAFVMEALLGLGCRDEAEAFFWWLMHASQITQPHLQVLYRLDGAARARERELPLDGYEGSRPVRVGNAAVEQLQLDIYGDLLQCAWLYARSGHRIDREFGDRLAAIADLVTEIWMDPDAGVWEVRGDPQHFTQSKMLCWIALDRARRLAEQGQVPAGHVDRWQSAADDIVRFVESRCWSEELGSYTRAADGSDLDASVLLGVRMGYGDPAGERFRRTIDAVRGGLGDGPLLRRYRSDDGVPGVEGAFLCCSFWLVEVLAMAGRVDEANDLFDRLLELANDVGLYAEEIDPATGAFLGNMPQGLTHLALLTAAAALDRSDG